MEYNDEHKLRASQLSFIAKVLSVFSHELKNHLAIINESAGLIMDYIESGKLLDRKDSDQYIKPLRSINNQMNRTLTLVNYLNRFSHRMDNPASTFNVNEALEELIILINRTANQHRVNIEKDFKKDIPLICSDPSQIQFLIFCFIERNIKRLSENSSIIVKTSHSDGLLSISIISKGNFIDADKLGICPDDVCQYIVKQLRGNILQKTVEVIITLPIT